MISKTSCFELLPTSCACMGGVYVAVSGGSMIMVGYAS